MQTATVRILFRYLTIWSWIPTTYFSTTKWSSHCNIRKILQERRACYISFSKWLPAAYARKYYSTKDFLFFAISTSDHLTVGISIITTFLQISKFVIDMSKRRQCHMGIWLKETETITNFNTTATNKQVLLFIPMKQKYDTLSF